MKFGIVPDRRFPPRSNKVIELRLPNSLGIGPVRRLFDRITVWSKYNAEPFDKGGTGPVNLLNERSKLSNKSFPRHVGMLPVKWDLVNCNENRLVRLQNEAMIEFLLKSLLLKSILSRLLTDPSVSGITPVEKLHNQLSNLLSS